MTNGSLQVFDILLWRTLTSPLSNISLQVFCDPTVIDFTLNFYKLSYIISKSIKSDITCFNIQKRFLPFRTSQTKVSIRLHSLSPIVVVISIQSWLPPQLFGWEYAQRAQAMGLPSCQRKLFSAPISFSPIQKGVGIVETQV